VSDASATFSFADLVRELALAWKTLAVYPPTHPACAGATDGAMRQLEGLTAPTGSFAIGVARDALVAGDERVTGSRAQRLAERLHQLGVGVVRFQQGIAEPELAAFLRSLRQEPGQDAVALLRSRLAEQGADHVEVEARDFSHLVATDDLEAPTTPAGANAPSLWEQILGNQLLRGPASGDQPANLARVVELINRYLPSGGYGEGFGDGLTPSSVAAAHAAGIANPPPSVTPANAGVHAAPAATAAGVGPPGRGNPAPADAPGGDHATSDAPGGVQATTPPSVTPANAGVHAASAATAAGPGAPGPSHPAPADAPGGDHATPRPATAPPSVTPANAGVHAAPAATAAAGSSPPAGAPGGTPAARVGSARGVTTTRSAVPGAGQGAVFAPELLALLRRVQEAVGGHTETAVSTGQLFLVRQVGELVGALPRGLREQVLDAALARLAGERGSRAGIETLATTVSATEMVTSLRRLRTQHRRLAHPAVAWLEALQRSDTLAAAGGPAATSSELQALLAEGEDRPMLRADEPVLEQPPEVRITPLSGELAAEARGLLAWQQVGVLLRTLVELLEAAADEPQAVAVLVRLESLFLQLLQGLRLPAAKALVTHLEGLAHRRAAAGVGSEGAHEAARGIADAIAASLERLRGTATVSLLVELVPTLQPDELAAVRAWVGDLGRPLIRALLLALGEEEDRARRRVLFDFVRSLSAEVVDEARALLADPRWYVVRNMIALLHSVGDQKVGPQLVSCLEHPDPRVRLEALRNVAEVSAGLPPALVRRLMADPDPKVAARAARLGGNLGAERATAPLLAVVSPLDPLGRHREERIRALLALGDLGDPEVLPRIKRFFSTLTVDHPDERRAAFQSLAGYPEEARAPFVEKGLRSRDPAIRALCERLTTEDPRHE
jgi:hypothetical protein